MPSLGEIAAALSSGEADAALGALRGEGGAERTRSRALRAAEGCLSVFGRSPGDGALLASAPGRAELGGNHTDHQRGRVLCAAVGLDALGCAARNGLDRVRVYSEGFGLTELALPAAGPDEKERCGSAALIRGIAAALRPEGFDAYVLSDVPPGSGLSSSAAFELLIAVMCAAFSGDGDACGALRLASVCQRAENEYFGKPCGLLDQAASALGGVQEIDFADPARPSASGVGFDFGRCGHRMCVVNCGAPHGDLTADYAAITAECRAVAGHFGAEVLREVDSRDFLAEIPALRRALGDRAVLRAMHFFAENERVAREVDALRRGDFGEFLRCVDESGRSSAELLQNLWPGRDAGEQPLMLAVALARDILAGSGACRVHGGGFGGTALAFVPEGLYGEFSARMEAVFGPGSCRALSVRPSGAAVIDI